ncbi:MAG: hypothetical protein AAF108_07515 [Planctomycetota bacterium]
MNLAHFFEHWGIVENPFRGEEARHDGVFARLGVVSTQERERLARHGLVGGVSPRATHSDFEKILGSLTRPSTSIVFGEKGSGKTAIRLQIEDSVRAHNGATPEGKVFLVAYDDLNGVLDQVHRRVAGGGGGDAGEAEIEKTFARIRLVDHMDAMLSAGVTSFVNGLIEGKGESAKEARRRLRSLSEPAGDDLLLLQSVYDAELSAPQRTRQLRRTLGRGLGGGAAVWTLLLFLGWVPAAGFVLLATLQFGLQGAWVFWVFAALLGIYSVVLAKVLLLDRWSLGGLGRRVAGEVVALPRVARSYAESFGELPAELRRSKGLPTSGSEETRYAMMDRFRRVLEPFGYTGMLVVIDRVDEPVLVNGDAERMRLIIWPLLNNKFLQKDGFGVKMLLPIELRHALYKESARFFQEARLDKQSLVDRLSWTGAALYDLAEARLRACSDRGSGAAENGSGNGPADGRDDGLSLLSLFAEDVSRQDVVDALDQMHQPRDAFKFLYQCLTEHCSNVTTGERAYRVPKLVLESVRKQQSDRVQALYRGVTPA